MKQGQERRDALARLRSGDVSVVFSVDLFNEGVDVPDVDTVLMLRPTESPNRLLLAALTSRFVSQGSVDPRV